LQELNTNYTLPSNTKWS